MNNTKKTFLAISFFAVVIFCFPLSARGVIMEIAVTITSVRSPQRAAMALLPVDTEFGLRDGYMVITDNGGSIVARSFDTDYTCPYYCRYYNLMQKDAVKIIDIRYDASKVPYKVYAEISTNRGQYSYDTIYKADCTLLSPVPVGAGWYSLGPIYYNNFVNMAYCPNPPATVPYYAQYIAVDPANIVNGYWRSPFLFEIN